MSSILSSERDPQAGHRFKPFNTRRFPGIKPISIAFFTYLYLPIIILMALSFNRNQTVTVWTGFTLDWYSVVLGNDDLLRAAWNSLIIALSSSVSATTFATMAALATTNRTFRGQNVVTGLLALPLVVPEIVTAVATLLFFALLGFKLGHLTVIVAHTVFCIPFAYLPIRARLQGMDNALMEAAADLYANPWLTFRRITLPLLWPGILSGLILAFIISLDDFVITFFVAGAGATTLPIYIFGMVRIGITPEVNAASSLLLVVSVIFVTLSFFLSKRQNT